MSTVRSSTRPRASRSAAASSSSSSSSAPPASVPKSSAKPKASRKAGDHPAFRDMVTNAIVTLKERSGSSRHAIKKYIIANYAVGDNAGAQIKLALKKGVAEGIFLQPKGVSGPVKLAKKEKMAIKSKSSKNAKSGGAAAKRKKAAGASSVTKKKKSAAAKKRKATVKKAGAPKKKAAATKKAAKKT